MQEIKVEKVKRTDKVTIPQNPGFGKLFTDHVFEMDYAPNVGWHNARIKPLENLQIHPAMMFIHYGQAIFEGIKAFKNAEGEPAIFRPEKNVERFNNSAKRLCMPEIDEEFFMKALTELISVERDWIPDRPGESLYIRPFMYASDPFLGVRPSMTYKMIILLSPVGAYYPEGFKPVKILIQDEYVRAVRKGIGECKTAGNYAGSLLAAEEAKKRGFTQVLWLDAIEQKYIEEVGTMNIFVRFKNEVATPQFSGSILRGVTRDSVIQILKEWGENVTERLISVDEIVEEYKKGNVLEIFGTGTAAIISAVGWLQYKDLEMVINNGEAGELALKLFNEITAIQTGKTEDKHNWLTYVDKKSVEV